MVRKIELDDKNKSESIDLKQIEKNKKVQLDEVDIDEAEISNNLEPIDKKERVEFDEEFVENDENGFIKGDIL